MVYQFRRLQNPVACPLKPPILHLRAGIPEWARRNRESLCFAASSVDVRIFMPFAGRAATGDLDTCPKLIATGNHIYVPETRIARRLIA
jgi:hypothetical protein